MIADSAMELYQCQADGAARRLQDRPQAATSDRGVDGQALRRQQRSDRIIDRAIQVHGALGYSTDTPLADMYQHARWARFADGADEIHQMRIAQRTIAAYKDTRHAPAPPPATCRSERALRRGERSTRKVINTDEHRAPPRPAPMNTEKL